MKIFKETLIIFTICMVSRIISGILPFTFPDAIIALFLLLILLWSKVIKEDDISSLSSFFLANMAFFFIPATVRIIESLDVLLSAIWPILTITFLSTIVTFFMSAKAVDITESILSKRNAKKKEEAEA